MDTLETLLARLARKAGARWWAGARPDVPGDQVARVVAGRLSYPTPPSDPFAHNGMVRLTWAQAAHVLAVAATTSLAYGEPRPHPRDTAQAAEALRALAGDATFFSNGWWDPGTSWSWTPLTGATFDCGLIGYDSSHAFIFWVEEED